MTELGWIIANMHTANNCSQEQKSEPKLANRQIRGNVHIDADRAAQEAFDALRQQGRREIAEARASGSAPFIWKTMREWHATQPEGPGDPEWTAKDVKTLGFRCPDGQRHDWEDSMGSVDDYPGGYC